MIRKTSNYLATDAIGSIRKYIPYGAPEKTPEEEKLEDDGLVSFSQLIDGYSRVAAMHRTGLLETEPTEEDVNLAYRIWRASEKHIQSN